MIMIAVMMTIVTSASAMTYSQAKDQALFLADKMAYELNLTDEQYEAAYEINLDYLMAVNDYNDVYGTYWTRRNLELQSILAAWQYNIYIATEYFYRPLYWSNNRWNWRVYTHYSYNKYYKPRPKVYVTYRGGNDKHYYTSRSWNKPTTRKVVKTNNNCTWNVPGNSKNVNTGNRTFGNGNRTTVNRTTNVNVTNINVNNNNNNRTVNNRSFGSPSNTTTRTVAQAKTNGNTRSFGTRQVQANNNSNASKGTFGRR